jgi:GNAT superfamily N-acetyltransferase
MALGRQVTVLRQAIASDIAGMHRVRMAVHENKLSDPSRISEADYRDSIEKLGRGWVIENEGVIVAFAFGYTSDGSIWALFVDPEHEGKGYGKQLHEVMIDWLWSQGLTKLWLTTANNSRAEGFYAAMGWQQCGAPKNDNVRFELTRSN